MRKVFLLVLLFSFGPLIWVSCCSSGEPCPDVKFPYFSIHGFNVITAITGDDKDTPKYSRFNIWVSLDVDYFAIQNREVPKNGLLLACRPDDCLTSGYKGAKIGLDTILVITKNNYRHDFQAGDTINEICEVDYRKLEWYIQDSDSIVKDEFFEIKLAEAPGAGINPQAFRIVYTLDDGRSFEAETEEVYLWP